MLYPHELRQRCGVGRIEIVRNLTLQHFGSQLCLMIEAASMQILFICCSFFPSRLRQAGFSNRIPLLVMLIAKMEQNSDLLTCIILMFFEALKFQP
jgi:hypothetical protein